MRFASAPDAMNYLDKVMIDNLKLTLTMLPDTYYPGLVNATDLHAQGIDGSGIGVAVIDTGGWSHAGASE